MDSIDLGSAERIEVLRGPASSLYGNASGGVIAVESELGQVPSYVEGSVAAGELGYSKYGLKTAGVAGDIDFLFNLSHQEVDGYREHADARGSLLNSRVGVPIGDEDRLTVAFNYSDQPEAQDPGGVDAAQAAAMPRSARDRNILFDAGEALDQQRIGFVFERPRDAGTLMLRNYYTWRDFANKLPFTDGGIVEFDRFVYGAGVRYRFEELVPEAWELAIGVDLDRQDDDRRRFDNDQGDQGALVFDQRERVSSDAVYAQAKYRLNERWSLSGGLRYDDVEFDISDRFLVDGDDSGVIAFDQLSPSLGINLELGEQILFASYSSSFETPTTTELANPDASGGFNPASGSPAGGQLRSRVQDGQ
ncbi:MAG: TonB-dependent receptor [Woeseiaceae bacterium]|nr:TonB-dependent receptor [Woeseiaceae bacterium]